MRILLVRHGLTVDPYGAPSDELRWLTPEGRLGMRRVADALRAEGLEFTRMWTSPLVRAVQTATILVGDLAGVPLETHAPLSPDYGSTAQALSVLEQAGEDDTVVLVGHEPKIRILAGHLGGVGSMPGFSPGAVCLVETEGERRRLRWMLDPRTLARVDLGQVA